MSAQPTSGISSTATQSPHQQQTHNRSLSGTASMLNQFSDLTSNFSLKNNPISSTNFLSRATSITSQVSNVAGRISSTIKDISGKSKVLLVIDDNQIEWSKYFRSKKIVGDFDISVVQCEFRDLTLYAHNEFGTICNVVTQKKQFRPDFVFVREHVKNNQEDHTSIILGLRYGNVPSINNLLSIYNFIDRPLMYAELINIQRKLGGKDKFPLIEQTFYPTFKEMIQSPPKFPCVIKLGHFHSGLGKLKVDSLAHFQELLSVLACINNYLTAEPYIDARCDVHVQKIGNNYKAFMRKSISGGWKSNVGSAVLEQINVTDKYKQWADEVAKLFGGLDLVTIEIVETQNNEQFIYEVTGSQMALMGETQEEDRRLISELIAIRMQQAITSQLGGQVPKRSSVTQLTSDSEASQQSPLTSQDSQQHQPQFTSKPTGFLQRMGSISGSIGSTLTSVTSGAPGSSILSNKMGTNTSIEKDATGQTSGSGVQLQQSVTDTVDRASQQIRGLFRRASQTTNDEAIPNQTQNPSGGTTTGAVEDGEDTMKNLRKTFAGIFGDN